MDLPVLAIEGNLSIVVDVTSYQKLRAQALIILMTQTLILRNSSVPVATGIIIDFKR